ncbi:hypothetical protein HRR83_007422 [Exophiala dermatitidis]|uniref:Uncharacterized protein n=1 Tax=Exophiala dermatitidis TaxID=5970 RepID=A0AAN6ISL5_EXODE|nr:hypothetical protein HRR74_006868 [Exophiala dermatitidis]KAJ4510669.1 hypothetical protein HRR73_006741 [Exophiala dermatitidis]KAJ4535005.1 hypothetical protein HRR76_006906 [Exophiala dermatitidis]KAJ4536073.1 hypothetical protein HRR77_007519 [Exophiala dermatitidis]KAJ4571087.1 hypothetical protein HRR79_004001 [Exophiala dermatitidis]
MCMCKMVRVVVSTASECHRLVRAVFAFGRSIYIVSPSQPIEDEREQTYELCVSIHMRWVGFGTRATITCVRRGLQTSIGHQHQAQDDIQILGPFSHQKDKLNGIRSRRRLPRA